jgi:sugar lactone lactonase YvrE
MNRSSFFIASTLAAIAGTCALVACGDDDTVTNDILVDAGQDGTTTGDTGTPDTGGQDGAPDTSVDAGPAVTATTIVKTNAALGELAESVAYRGTDTYLSYAPTGKIVKVSANGTVTPYAQVPISATSASKNFALGLAFDAAGALYVAVSTATPADALAPAGVYKIPAGGTDGGAITPVPFATNPNMNFPNALLFDGAGLLWITDSFGTLFNVNATTGGVATAYLADPAFQGDNAACPLPGQPFPIGANGIALDSTKANFYIANTNKGTITRVPRLTDGGTPTATVVINDCAKLEGIDGLITDTKTGNLIATNNGQNLIQRIVPPVGDAGVGTITNIYAGPPLDAPAAIVEIPGSVSPQVFHIANAAFTSASLPADAGVTPAPGLVKLTIR